MTKQAFLVLRAGCLVLGLVLGLSSGCAGVWLLVREPCSALAAAVSEGGPAAAAELGFPRSLTALCAWLVLGCAGWLTVTVSLAMWATVVTAGPGAGRAGMRLARLVDRTCPRFAADFARRLVVAGFGLALGSGVAGAAASGDSDDVAGLAVPDRTTGGRVDGPLGPVADSQARVRVRVRPGDSLWGIAADLSSPATDSEVAAACRALYQRNARVVGPDPDLIFPGTLLQVPPDQRSVREERR